LPGRAGRLNGALLQMHLYVTRRRWKIYLLIFAFLWQSGKPDKKRLSGPVLAGAFGLWQSGICV